MTVTAWQTAYESRNDLDKYGDNALGLFALALHYGLDDLDSVASDTITDGSDDKKCDLIYIDYDRSVCVVAQCYISSKQKPSAPSNKASDLNTAASWLLTQSIDSLPKRISPHAIALRSAIKDRTIDRLEFWYVHNLPQSENVNKELRAVATSASAITKNDFPDCSIKCYAIEVGAERLDDWYTETQSPILVNETVTIRARKGYEIQGGSWKSYVTSIQLRFLQNQYKKHKAKLFSANVRDYLGSRSSDANINNGIKQSAQESASDFWAYNNGLTILVNSYKVNRRNGKVDLTVEGISIVNGAQTTGSVGSITSDVSLKGEVSARFIETQSRELIYNIIRFNNSQNKVSASDFRSTDSTQRRIKEEMASIPKAEYEGGRRGGVSDAIQRKPNLLPSYTVGQALAAVHGDPTVAYNQKADIWSKDSLYTKYFNEQTSATHIVFCYSLTKCIEDVKVSLVQRSKSDIRDMTDEEREYLSFLRRRGLIFFLQQQL